MSTNIPLGTYVTDGVRTGPVYSGQVPSTLLPFNPTETLSYGAYSAYGPGVALSTQATWNITPNSPNSSAGYSSLTNLVAVTLAASITGAGDLTLRGDDNVTKIFGGNGGAIGNASYVQFDWPRLVTVTIGGTADAGAVNVTVFGEDYYGNPMQHTYAVNARRTYPTITLGPNGGLDIPAKAFYTVTRVYVSGALAANSTISLGAADVFGLPYRVDSAGNISAIAWGNSSDLSSNSGALSTPATGTSALNGTTNVVVAAPTVNMSSIISITYAATPAGNITITKQNGTSFTIVSSDAGDTMAFSWSVTNFRGPVSGTSAAMNAGSVTVYTSEVQANSVIHLTMGTFGTAHGAWRVSSIVPGSSFTVTSSAGTETSTVQWAIMPSNWVSGTSAALESVGGVRRIFVSAPSVTANSKILLTYNTFGGTQGVLSAPAALITPGVGFTIVSSNNLDTSTVNWTIVRGSTNITAGTATLDGANPGTVQVLTTAAVTGSTILLTNNTSSTPGTYVRVSAIASGTSFTITSQGNADASTVNWMIFPPGYTLPQFTAPLGAFIPADKTFPVTATTGDVRGMYAPSTPADGVSSLAFTAYIEGADNWINQTANSQFLASAANQAQVGVEVAPLTPADLYGPPQFYTGNPS